RRARAGRRSGQHRRDRATVRVVLRPRRRGPRPGAGGELHRHRADVPGVPADPAGASGGQHHQHVEPVGSGAVRQSAALQRQQGRGETVQRRPGRRTRRYRRPCRDRVPGQRRHRTREELRGGDARRRQPTGARHQPRGGRQEDRRRYRERPVPGDHRRGRPCVACPCADRAAAHRTAGGQTDHIRSPGAAMPTAQEYDGIIVGFGAAGASAAIEAADRGARGLVLDRGHGGGATAYSGGIVYAGAGTAEQQAGGHADSVENMRAYLAREVGDAVSPETLTRFCEQSPAMIEWLKAQGVEFRGGPVPPYKTSYPTDEHYLYYSGNETAFPYSEHAHPAPRGHRALAPGMRSGRVLFERLRDSALSKGVEFVPLAHVHSLIQADDGRVTGVRYTVLDPGHRHAPRHRLITRATGKLGTWMPGVVSGAVRYAERLRAEASVETETRAGAVILAAGGFINNRGWVRQYAPQFLKISPLGTVGDDGTGIRLGLDAGGK